ncbi:MAG: gliding motility-associated C-terminal domain-containing protein [Paludibacteraceae bacterium]|nr:gliding motility-associated C-terminal domain-containing protein [Paludibacteraceae bacterium]
MKYYFCFAILLYGLQIFAQCPVIEGAMINACGATEGNNEFLVFSTTASATVGSYTLYYGSNNPPTTSTTSKLSGADATTKTGTTSITSSCTFTEVTSSSTVIPANSRVVFIPSDFNNSYDISNLCSGSNLYIVYINRTGSSSKWPSTGNFANSPSGNRYLQLVNSASSCTSGIVSYTNSLLSASDGDFVSWTSSGTATGSNNGCTTLPPVCTPPTALVLTGSTLCGGTTGSIASSSSTSGISYQLYNSSGTAVGSALTGTGSALTWSNISSGTGYYVIGTNTSTSCTSTSNTASVVINSSPTALVLTGSTICSGATSSITSSTSTSGISYQLYNSSNTAVGSAKAGTGSALAWSGIAAGTGYYIIGTNATTTCTSTSNTVSVVVNSLPTALVLTGSTVCSGVTTSITSSTSASGVSYQLYNSSGTAVGSALTGTGSALTWSSITAGTGYYVIGTNTTTTCTSTSNTVSVAVNSLPSALVLTGSTLCGGTTGTITSGTSTSGVSYQLYNSSGTAVGSALTGTGSALTWSNISSGTGYYVIGTNTSTSCTSTSNTVSAVVNSLPTITVSTLPACATNLVSYSLGVTVSTGNVTCTNGTVTNTSGNVWSISSIPTGTNVVVTVTDANTCSAQVNINAPNCSCSPVNAPVSGGNKSYCSSSAIPSISATVGTGETVDWYSLSTGGTALLSNSLSYTPTTIGTYYAEARNTTTNCTSSSRTGITVTENTLPTISGSLSICGTGNTLLIGSGTAATTNSWTSGTATVATVSGTSTTGTVTGAAAGTSVISYKDNNGCTNTATVTVNAAPTITVSTSPACATNLLTYSLGVTVSTGNVTSTSGTVTNTSGNVWSVSSIPTGTNIVVTVTDANTCSAQVSITTPNCSCSPVNAPVSGGNKSYCSGSAIPSISATVGTGETVDWYSLSTGGTLLLNNSLSYTPTTAGTYYAEARNTTTNCISSSRTSITVTKNTLPTISGTLAICGTGFTSLTGSGTAASSSPWNSASSTVATVSGTNTTGTVTGVAAGTSIITYKDNNGCTSTTTVTVNAAPTATINYPVSSFCKSSAKTTQVAILSGTGNYTGGAYTATPAGLNINTSTGDIAPGNSNPGTYTVTYTTNATGCTTYSTHTTITIAEAPTASISYKASPYYSTISTPQAVTLTGETGGTFSATDGLTIDANTGSITPNTSDIGTYIVSYTIHASGECAEVLTTATVEIVELLEEVYIPQGFSPNGDGVNDYFVINNIEQYPHNHIVILNRWGDKVYESNPYANGWDGRNYFGLKMGTDPLPIGTYFYILDLGNKSKIKKGSVYLSR